MSAPRSLKAPVSCWFSYFTQTSAPVAFDSVREWFESEGFELTLPGVESMQRLSARVAIVAAAVVTMAVFAVPHSLFGSELKVECISSDGMSSADCASFLVLGGDLNESLRGNRTQVTIGASSYGYTVAANSNRLSATAGPAPAQTNTYDASGNLTGNGTYTLAYSDRGRLKSATLAAGTVSYVYNALEQRVRKSGPTSLVATGASLYVYDEAGRLLAARVVLHGSTPVHDRLVAGHEQLEESYTGEIYLDSRPAAPV